MSLAATTTDLAITNAIPNGTHATTKYLLYVSGGVLFEYDIANNQVVGQLSVTGSPGALASLRPPPKAVNERSPDTAAVLLVRTNPIRGHFSSDLTGSRAGFKGLQTTTNLARPVVWSPVSPSPVVIEGLSVVINSMSGTQRYYRLSR